MLCWAERGHSICAQNQQVRPKSPFVLTNTTPPPHRRHTDVTPPPNTYSFRVVVEYLNVLVGGGNVALSLYIRAKEFAFESMKSGSRCQVRIAGSARKSLRAVVGGEVRHARNAKDDNEDEGDQLSDDKEDTGERLSDDSEDAKARLAGDTDEAVTARCDSDGLTEAVSAPAGAADHGAGAEETATAAVPSPDGATTEAAAGGVESVAATAAMDSATGEAKEAMFMRPNKKKAGKSDAAAGRPLKCLVCAQSGAPLRVTVRTHSMYAPSCFPPLIVCCNTLLGLLPSGTRCEGTYLPEGETQLRFPRARTGPGLHRHASAPEPVIRIRSR